MEQNDFPAGETQGSTGASAGTNFGGTGNTGASNTDNTANEPITDRARELAGSAKDTLADVGSTVKDRAGNLKNTVADALETGADKLRRRAQSGDGQLAGAATGGSVALENDGRTAQLADRVAGGMQASADWIRDADLDGLKTGIERQVKEHPGRTLLIAVGLGYLLGKALRK